MNGTQIRVRDRADEFRVTISGHFAGECVTEVAEMWEQALAQMLSRRFKIDISALTGYDTVGCRLLRDMYRHGTIFAAATPLSLVFLNEISVKRRSNVKVMPDIRERPELGAEARNTFGSKPKLQVASAGK